MKSREECIRDFQTRKILGFLRYKPNGDIEAVDFASRRILGFYRAATDETVEFQTRKVIAKGNCAISFIYAANKK